MSGVGLFCCLGSGSKGFRNFRAAVAHTHIKGCIYSERQLRTPAACKRLNAKGSGVPCTPKAFVAHGNKCVGPARLGAHGFDVCTMVRDLHYYLRIRQKQLCPFLASLSGQALVEPSESSGKQG